ncbi:AMP-binding protein [Undibacterium sp. Di27W]|uniref:AMP-binding protein n=1 Tax=Undibacterium sp. Di27W TaxID=3413036 RepID=UPI003BF06EB6
MSLATSQEISNFPTLSEHGKAMLDFMVEHPSAPAFRNHSGNRLLAQEVEELREFENAHLAAPVAWAPGILPDWLDQFITHVFAHVPHYRSLGSVPKKLVDVPAISRADLAADIAAFVPDTVELARLINFRTTGTTGHPMLIASHPVVAARYLTFHKRALLLNGITLRHGRGQVGVVLVGFQQRCFTYTSVTPTMDDSGLAKINLHVDDWRDPADRACYLDALAPEVMTGDPLSFAELAKLELTKLPRALISVSMAMSPGMRHMLEARFRCPVLDIYSLNEVGPVAVYDAAVGGHLLLQPELYVEILDKNGQPVAAGQRGEICLSGGFNFCMPLLRYRTGDFAAMANSIKGPMLLGLAGRSPVRFQTRTGDWVNNIDITHALQALPLPQYGFHQKADGRSIIRLAPSVMYLADQAKQALAALFDIQQLSVEMITTEDKILQYTSDLEGAYP